MLGSKLLETETKNIYNVANLQLKIVSCGGD